MAIPTVNAAAPRALEPTPLAPAAPQAPARPTAPASVNTLTAPAHDLFDGVSAPAAPATTAIPGVPPEAQTNPGLYMHELLTGAVPFPPDFQRVMGYTPDRVETRHGTRMQDPHGDVSSPGGIGPTEEFLPPAKTHDLGYDILRFFGKMNQPLGPDARKTADAQFRQDCFFEANDNHQGLDAWRARSWAQIYSTAVELNSKRQNYGVP